MIQALRLDSVRGRLTLFWVAVLATALVTVGGLIYVLLARALYTRIDENLRAVLQIARTSLANDLGEGQDYVDAARSTAANTTSVPVQAIAIRSSDDRGGAAVSPSINHEPNVPATIPPTSAAPYVGQRNSRCNNVTPRLSKASPTKLGRA